MKAIFLHALSRSYILLLGWGIGMAVLGGYLIEFYDAMVGQQGILEQLMNSLSEDLYAFFGSVTEFSSPDGYLTMEFFSYMPVILGILAVIQGSGMLSSDEENGSLDLLLAHPVSRATAFFGRFFSLIVVFLGISLLIWIGFLIALQTSTMQATPAQLLLPFISLWAITMVFGSLGLLMSMVLPSRAAAGMAAGVILVASYFLTSLTNIDERLQGIERFSPIHYYQSGDAMNGLNMEWFLALTAAWIILTLLAWLKFSTRDIRISGEGGWEFLIRLIPGKKARSA